MRIRYSNAVLWRGLDASVERCDFDVVEGVIESPTNSERPTHLVDLDGAFVMPGFRDGHAHPLFAGREHLGLDVTDASTLTEVQARLRDYAAQGHDWIDAAAYDRSIDAQFIRQELDAVVADRPVVLHGADHHTLWVNTKALEVCGLMDVIPVLNSGSVDLDSDAVPTGMLREWDAMQLVLGRAPQLTMEQEIQALEWAQTHLHALGIVEVQDAWIDRGMTEVYLEAAAQKRLNLATKIAFRADPLMWREDFAYFVDMLQAVDGAKTELLQANAMKFFVDGVLGSATASVLEPYEMAKSGHSHGEQVWSPECLLEAAREADRLGFQLHLHAIGDGAVRTALDVFQEIAPRLQPVIAHTEMVSDADVARFAELDVTANFEPLWAREDGQLLSCLPQVGRKRIDGMYRMRDLVDAGTRLSFGSDWPVSSPDPVLGFATAVNRSLPGGSSWTPSQALTKHEALVSYTSQVARQLSNSSANGTLNVGEPAAFVVLSGNPFETTNESLFDLKVLATSTKPRPYLG